MMESHSVRRLRRRKLLEKETALPALKQAFIMLRPDMQWKNPVMFVVEIGALLILFYILQMVFGQKTTPVSLNYFIALDFWLFLTVLFSNFATALAEARGKAQANSLRQTRKDTVAHRLKADKTLETVSSADLKKGDLVVVAVGQTIPGDGEVIEGIAYIDESAITGESAPVIRDAGSDHSGVTGGTIVLSDQITVCITGEKGDSFLDRMIGLVEGAIRQRSPNEVALTIILSAFTLIFLIVVVPLWPIAYNTEQYMMTYLGLSAPLKSLGTDVPTLIALLVCLIPTTIGALLSAIGIAGMDRALQANILASSGKAVELAGDIDIIMLDKTGTITIGNRSATKFIPFGEHSEEELGKLAALSSASDTTPEGKSILKLYTRQTQKEINIPEGSKFIPFTAHTRMSGVDLPDGRLVRKGTPDAIIKWAEEHNGPIPQEAHTLVDQVASKGATPLLIANGNEIIGLLVLEDVLKPYIHERFARLRKMGLRTVMITGDNRHTAAAIAAQAGVDDFLAEATPTMKLEYIRQQQAEGKLVAMMGDGTNDAPALAQADVAMAMNAGTEAAKEAANMID